MLETIGFVLLVSTCGDDACEALPVTEDIYTRHECELRLKYIAKRRPNLYFMCNEVMRENGSGDDDSPGIPDDPEDTPPPDEQPQPLN
ncbi:hypothetical protein ABK654_13965 [Morganella morganii]|uniref:hypothetical protein n=1 Tax=Morganella morganii TaxID=582 RepID=UPI0037521E55